MTSLKTDMKPETIAKKDENPASMVRFESEKTLFSLRRPLCCREAFYLLSLAI